MTKAFIFYVIFAFAAISYSATSMAEDPSELQKLLDYISSLFLPKEEGGSTSTNEKEKTLKQSIKVGAERRVAIVIGNGQYKKGQLLNPENDARAIASRLRALGFEVLLHENVKIREISSIYREMREKITPGSVSLVFYAGHGVQFKGQNYFPAVDAEILSEEDVPLQSLHLATLIDTMEESKSELSLVFLDACRDNPFARRVRGGSRGLAKIESASGTLIHYATRPGSVASDGEGKNGTYTESLLTHIGETDVPVELMLKRVTNRVVGSTNGRQEPWVEGSLRGDFYFAPQGDGNVYAATYQVEAREADAWRAAESSDTATGYHVFISAFPAGVYSSQAKSRLANLEKNATTEAKSSVSAAALPTISDQENRFWIEVKESEWKEYYQAYLNKYPKGQYLDNAKSKLQSIQNAEFSKLKELEAENLKLLQLQSRLQEKAEQDAWNYVRLQNTGVGYVSYIEAYPSGVFLKSALAAIKNIEAELRLETKNDQSVREFKTWLEADKSNTKESYLEFVNKFPNSKLVSTAIFREKNLGKISSVTQLGRTSQLLPQDTKSHKGISNYKPGDIIKDCPECPDMVIIPAGSYKMGSLDPEARAELPSHVVKFEKIFAIGKTEITQGQWKQIMGYNPSYFSNCGDDCPVEKVSWNDLQEFIRRLNAKTGEIYRLPSESEWEYVARANSVSVFSFGNTEIELKDHGWFSINSEGKTHPVGLKSKNGFGLFDTMGNVWEWTDDCWNSNYLGAPVNGRPWLEGDCSARVLRGGSWNGLASTLRNSNRLRGPAGMGGFGGGFRITKSLIN